MSFYRNVLNISVFPPVTSKMDVNTKLVYKKKYRNIKRYVVASTLYRYSTGVSEETQLVKDILNSKLKV